MNPDYLFVYGTLRSEFDNEMALKLRKQTTFTGKGFCYGELYDLGNYPAAHFNPRSKTPIYGEVYELKDNKAKFLKTLDDYEGIDDPEFNIYERRVIQVYLNDSKVNCWIYHLIQKSNDFPLITEGDYVNYLNLMEED